MKKKMLIVLMLAVMMLGGCEQTKPVNGANLGENGEGNIEFELTDATVVPDESSTPVEEPVTVAPEEPVDTTVYSVVINDVTYTGTVDEIIAALPSNGSENYCVTAYGTTHVFGIESAKGTVYDIIEAAKKYEAEQAAIQAEKDALIQELVDAAYTVPGVSDIGVAKVISYYHNEVEEYYDINILGNDGKYYGVYTQSKSGSQIAGFEEKSYERTKGSAMTIVEDYYE